MNSKNEAPLASFRHNYTIFTKILTHFCFAHNSITLSSNKPYGLCLCSKLFHSTEDPEHWGGHTPLHVCQLLQWWTTRHLATQVCVWLVFCVFVCVCLWTIEKDRSNGFCVFADVLLSVHCLNVGINTLSHLEILPLPLLTELRAEW